MNEGHRTSSDEHDRHADTVSVFDGIPASMKLHDTGWAMIDELFRLFIVPAATFSIVVLRAWYQAKKPWKARIVEGLLFGIASSFIHPVAQHILEKSIGLPSEVAFNGAITVVFVIGYVGADAWSYWLKRYMEGSIDGRKP